MDCKGVLFDFNGTMFFDADKHLVAWERLGERLVGRPVTGEEIKALFGVPNAQIIERFLGRPLPEEQALALSEEKEALYRRLCLEDPEGLHLAAGLEPFLDFLAARGIPRTIASGATGSNIDAYFEWFGLGRWFQREKVVCDDGSLPGKPDPDIYLRAARQIGLPPERCLVVEDAMMGVRAAQAAGVAGIGVVAPPGERAPFAGLEGVVDVIGDFTEFDRSIFC